MSNSAPSDSSTIDPTFLVGTDLVEFDRHDLPIYQTAQASWDGVDEVSYGTPLDRLFGEPGEVHVDGTMPGTMHETPPDIAALGHDPLVTLGSLSDGLALPGAEAPAAHQPEAHIHAAETVSIFASGIDAHAVVHLHDGWNGGWSWDASGADWTFDFRG